MIGNLLRVSNAELEEYINDSSKLYGRIYNDKGYEDPKLTDVEKAWAGILFLLTGKNIDDLDHPLAKVLFSGQLIDEDQDLGYGPANYLTPIQVSEINAQISKISTEELKRSFDAKRMMTLEIYPTIWDEGDEAFEYLNEYFKALQQVYSDATKNGEAIITFIN
ncbi:MAG: YfbM family protein [Flavobacteriales bacterium]|nr:YfbM family protein [Flavobacteriales bacterium]